MNQRAMGLGSVIVEPTKINQWRVEGEHAAFRITLADSGGWNVTGDTISEEHFSLLHHALIRAYNLAVGLVT